MRTGSLLLLALVPSFGAGCLYVTARKVAPEYADRGNALPGNPYDHLAAPEYTQGRISGFRELYVDPDGFAGALKPAAELPKETEKAVEKSALPPDLLPAMLVQVDLAKLGENRTWDQVSASLVASRPGLFVTMPTAGALLFKAPLSSAKGAAPNSVDPKAAAKLQKELESISVTGAPLGSIATFGLVQEYPPTLLAGYPMPPQGNLIVVAPAPPPPPPGPTRGTLPIENVTTSYAWVSVNGQKVGVVPPLARARVRDLPVGLYNVSFLLPNAFEWTENIATRTDPDNLVNLNADRIVLSETVLFETNSAAIQADSFPLVEEIALFLEKHPELAKVRIEGHTDSDGDDASNQALSEQRAKALVQALISRGVSPTRLVSVGFGESRPVQQGDSPAAKAANRRVDLFVEERRPSGP
jgi:outer membrane protein OmpA-like peptidoglycan-associated protein